MRKILAAILIAMTAFSAAYGVPLDSFSVFSTAHPNTRPGQYIQLLARGTGTDDYYVMEVDPTTGALPVAIVSGSLVLGYDENYGAVGSNTLRTAAQIGNATGAAAFGTGNTSAQTLRVDIANDDIVPVSQSGSWTVAATQSGTWNINNISGTITLPTGAATESTLSTMSGKFNAGFGSALGSIRTSSQIGNGTGLADFNAGNASAQTIRTVIATDQSAIPVSQSGSWTVTTSSFPTTADTNYGTPGASTIRSASMLGVGSTAVSNSNPVPISDAGGSITVDGTVSASNFPATVDTNTGAAGASTIRTVLSTRQEAAATPLAVRISDGSSFVTPASTGRTYSDSARLDYSSSNVTTSAYVQVLASTAAAINAITVFNGCGESIYLATGGAGAEVVKSIVPPGGLDGTISLAIAASTRIAIKGLSGSCTSGQFIINGYQ